MMDSCDDVERDDDSALEDEEEIFDEFDEARYDARAYDIYQQLPVDDKEPDFESGSPETAEEYLRRVRFGPVSLECLLSMMVVILQGWDVSTLAGTRLRNCPMWWCQAWMPGTLMHSALSMFQQPPQSPA